MNEAVIRRFVQLAGIALVLAMLGTLVAGDFLTSAPGDYHVKKGGQRLQEGQYGKAMQNFELALEEQPNHRGALIGRALVHTQRGDTEKAIRAYTEAIDYLEKALPEDKQADPTGYGALAAAYANRGIVKDRAGRHREALDDYIAALRVDEAAVDGPSIFDEVLYGYRATTIRDRAEYLAKEFEKPPEERLLRLPEKDAEQRMYKP